MKKTAILRFFVVLASLLFVSCASKDLIRKDMTECNYVHRNDCSESAIQKVDSEDDYYLSFVEFDDQGQLLSREQLNSVVKKYQTLTSSGTGAIIVVFVHGWHHGALSGDENIESFRHLLADVSKNERATKGKSARKILGVYAAWRGDSIKSPLINWATFWERKSTAHEVGVNGLPEALIRLESIVASDLHTHPNSALKSRLIVVGHSFGGAIVFSALNNILVDRYYEASRKSSSGGQIKGFGDLVVLINPAFEAVRFATLYDIGQAVTTVNGVPVCKNYSDSGEQPPRLVILTSKADTATKVLFPAGRTFSTIFETHEKLERNDCVPDGRNNYVPRKYLVNEGAADRTAVGHFEPFITHKLMCINGKTARERDSIKVGFQELLSEWKSRSFNGEILSGNMRLIHLGKTHPFNPFLNIQVDRKIINDHNDIWGDEVKKFIADLILISSTK